MSHESFIRVTMVWRQGAFADTRVCMHRLSLLASLAVGIMLLFLLVVSASLALVATSIIAVLAAGVVAAVAGARRVQRWHGQLPPSAGQPHKALSSDHKAPDREHDAR